MKSPTESNLRSKFSAFLNSVTEGRIKPGGWEKYAVAHYSDDALEAIRVQLVRASIECGDWQEVPERLRAVARDLISRI